jgi:hypothetical protein
MICAQNDIGDYHDHRDHQSPVDACEQVFRTIGVDKLSTTVDGKALLLGRLMSGQRYDWVYSVHQVYTTIYSRFIGGGPYKFDSVLLEEAELPYTTSDWDYQVSLWA